MRRYSLHRDFSLMIRNGDILRVAGWLEFAEGTYSERHPIVFARGRRYNKLIVGQIYKQLLHAGVQDMFVHLRKHFWIIEARQVVKNKIFMCLICRRLNERHLTEVPTSLSADRVSKVHSIEVIDVDFVGRFHMERKGSSRNAYVVLFTCAITRAVHIELIADMSIWASLQLLWRFVSRREMPRVI